MCMPRWNLRRKALSRKISFTDEKEPCRLHSASNASGQCIKMFGKLMAEGGNSSLLRLSAETMAEAHY